MTLPIPPNRYCDVYCSGNAPPAASDISDNCYLTPCFGKGRRGGEGLDEEFRYTHTLLIDVTTDVRDGFTDFATPPTNFDTIYIPGDGFGNIGQPYDVVFVERIGRGTSADCLKVYLRRGLFLDVA